MTKTPSSDDCHCDQGRQAAGDRADRAVQEAIDQLKSHEKKILHGLANAENHARFLTDPRRVLEGLGLSVPSALAHHLRRSSVVRAETLTPPSEVVLPNGQRLRPQVRVRITGSKAGG